MAIGTRSRSNPNGLAGGRGNPNRGGRGGRGGRVAIGDTVDDADNNNIDDPPPPPPPPAPTPAELELKALFLRFGIDALFCR